MSTTLHRRAALQGLLFPARQDDILAAPLGGRSPSRVLWRAGHLAPERLSLSIGEDQLDAFGDDDVAAGSLLIPFAALVLEARLRHDDVRNLGSALESSRMIGTEVGVLMAAHQMPQEAAFEVLRRTSMDLNRKLRDVAVVVRRHPYLLGAPGAGRA